MKIFPAIESGEILNLSSDQIRLKAHSYRLHNRKANKKKQYDKAQAYFLISLICSRLFFIKSTSGDLNKELGHIGSHGKVQIKLSTNT